MNASDVWVETYIGPVRADQIVHIATNAPQLSVRTAVVPGNIEKLGEDRWFAEPHWYGVWGGDDKQRKVVARGLIREIALRCRDGIPGIIVFDQTSGDVSFVPFV